MNQDDDRDVELERLARRLGSRAAERLDVEGTAAAVVVRLRTERTRQRPWWMQSGWLRAAAVLLLVVGAGLVVRQRFLVHRAPADHYVREELQDLSTDQLREVLGSLDRTLTEATIEPADEDLNDLTTEQLRVLLQSLEG
ncbi:MAG TPA: hypothetical protein VLB49_11055 [Gemmatimonadales bacterium]|nr:hypothetical protein [Gemmatimonadales bacterium]